MKRLAVSYLVIIVLVSLAVTADPLGWLKKPSRDAQAPASDTAPAAPQIAAAQPGTIVEAAPPPGAAANPKPSRQLEEATALVLARLAQPADAAGTEAAPAPADALTAMSVSALAGLQAMRAPAPAHPAPVTLESLVTQALREGQSDAYIDALLNEAAGRGEIVTPAGLRTPEGRVDTAVLLASIVAMAQETEFGEGDAADPASEAVLPPRAQAETQDVLHLVQPGESLGGLALLYYGDAGKYPLIYDANRRVLSGPDRIAVGQRLVVPALSRL